MNFNTTWAEIGDENHQELQANSSGAFPPKISKRQQSVKNSFPILPKLLEGKDEKKPFVIVVNDITRDNARNNFTASFQTNEQP